MLVWYIVFLRAGFDIKGEDYTNKGRIDLSILLEGRCFIIEFKVVEEEKNTKKAIQQLRQKEYHKKYEGKAKEIYLIGIEFSKESKSIVGFNWEETLRCF